MEQTDALRAAVRDVPDFPKAGILFKDITPILGDGDLLRLPSIALWPIAPGQEIEKIVGIDARGFLFGATVADRFGIGFVPIRKRGKLPWKTESLAYKLEYGEADMEVHTDAFEPGERVSLIDDLLATGGTAGAASKAHCQGRRQMSSRRSFSSSSRFSTAAPPLRPFPRSQSWSIERQRVAGPRSAATFLRAFPTIGSPCPSK